MTVENIRARFHDLGVWQRGGERAPYKPLLLLYALGRYAHGAPRLLEYAKLDKELTRLFREFGPPRAAYHSVYPFWYLRTDGIWEVPGSEAARVREGKAGEPTKTWLRENRIAGGLTPELLKPSGGIALCFRTSPPISWRPTSPTPSTRTSSRRLGWVGLWGLRPPDGTRPSAGTSSAPTSAAAPSAHSTPAWVTPSWGSRRPTSSGTRPAGRRASATVSPCAASTTSSSTGVPSPSPRTGGSWSRTS